MYLIRNILTFRGSLLAIAAIESVHVKCPEGGNNDGENDEPVHRQPPTYYSLHD
jgi:hypothetical protein